MAQVQQQQEETAGQSLEPLLNAVLAIAQAADLEMSLGAILDQALALVGFPMGWVTVLDGQNLALVVQRGLPEDLASQLEHCSPDGCACEQVLSTAQVQVIDDPGWCFRLEEAGKEAYQGYVGVPAWASGRVWGVLNLLSSSPSPALSTARLGLLHALGGLAGVVIERKQLEKNLQRRQKELSLVHRMSQDLAYLMEEPHLLQTVLDEVITAIPAAQSCIIHFMEEGEDETDSWLVPRIAARYDGKISSTVHYRLPVKEGIAGWAVRERRTVYVPDILKEPRFLYIDLNNPPRFRSLMVAPLLVRDKCLGTISLTGGVVDAFTPDDERLLSILASQAAIALENARLFTETNRRVRELAFLNEASRTISSSLDLDHILDTLMREVRQVFEAQGGSVALLDRERGELVFRAADGPGAERVRGWRLKLGQGIAGWVAREGRPALVADASRDPRFYPEVDTVTGLRTQSVLCVPLCHQERVIGVVEVINKRGGPFTQADCQLLESLAATAAVAIENARLFEESRRAYEELALTQQQLVKAEQEAAVIALAGATAHELNQPMTVLLGLSELLRQELDPDSPLAQDLQIIVKNIRRMSTIVNNLGKITRYETKPYVGDQRILDLDRSVEDNKT